MFPSLPPELVARAAKIRLLVLDVDGVLTDGRLFFDNDGIESKAFHTLDGHGIKVLRASGVEVGIITGRSSLLVAKRAKDLGIHLLIQGREDKFDALQELLERCPCNLDEIAFMGDDWPDLRAMTRVGLALSVPNADSEVMRRAHWISSRQAGMGAVRDACEMLMQAQGTLEKMLAAYVHT